jgi:hypothetical protein
VEPHENAPAPRLVKLRLPADLVRRMDETILRSRGSFLDRNEFVAEALWDRLNEEKALADTASTTAAAPQLEMARAGAADRGTAADVSGWPFDGLADRLDVKTAPSCSDGGTIFGLHNRDLPSLYATALLVGLVRDAHAPVPWRTFTASLKAAAAAAGDRLRRQDAETRPALKSATGFPKRGDRASASADRFVGVSVGTSGGSGPTGPAFLLNLIGAYGDQTAVAPTEAGVLVLGELLAAGLTDRLPQPEAAARTWWTHLRKHAPDEAAAWTAVLARAATAPGRADLVAHFHERWPGSVADTNVMGYIARGREWGLVAPDMPEGRYHLTPTGEDLVAQEATQ